jgi:hypothetical protein
MSRLLVLLCLLASLLAFSACGGDDDEDVGQLLSQTFGGGGEDVKSGRLDLAMRLNAQGLPNVNGPIALRLSGPFQSTKPGDLPRFDFTLGFDAGGQNLAAGAVSTGDKGFLRFQNQAYAIGEDLFKQFRDGYAQQAKCAEEQGDKGDGVSFKSLGIEPNRWLRDPKRAGEEEVGGADTVHITAGVDVPKFLDDVNRVLGRTDLQQQQDPCAKEDQPQPRSQPTRRLTDAQRKQIAEAVKDARLEVWTGKDDKIMRRMNLALRFDVPEQARRNSRGLTRGDMRFDLSLGAVNEDQRIAPPRGAKPLEELIARFGGQVPGLGGAQAPQGGGQAPQGGAQAPQGGAAPQGGEQSSEYLQCVNEAGQDIKKLQACAELVGS